MFNINDTVRIKDNSFFEECAAMRNGTLICNETDVPLDMQKYFGKKGIIKSVEQTNDTTLYSLSVDNEYYFWSEEMLEKLYPVGDEEKTLIEMMALELYDTDLCHSDFKHDENALNKTNEPFFWIVREDGTNLALIGPSTMESYLQSEEWRIALMKNDLDVLANILYWNDKTSKYFYWDGYVLNQVNKEDISQIFRNIWGTKINKLKYEYPEEYEASQKPLELVFTDQEYTEEIREIAKKMKDKTLENCFLRMSNWVRRAVDHKFIIAPDSCHRSFFFREMVNGNPLICGGIIFHPDSDGGGRWCTHT